MAYLIREHPLWLARNKFTHCVSTDGAADKTGLQRSEFELMRTWFPPKRVILSGGEDPGGRIGLLPRTSTLHAALGAEVGVLDGFCLVVRRDQNQATRRRRNDKHETTGEEVPVGLGRSRWWSTYHDDWRRAYR